LMTSHPCTTAGGFLLIAPIRFGKGRAVNKVRLSWLLIALLLLFCFPATAGKIYKWRDANGRLHFSDSEQNVPPEAKENLKEYADQPPPASIPSNKNDSQSEKIEGNTASKPSKDDISIPFVSKEGSANRVIVNVTFNERVTVPILVDTGSPGLVISANLANRLGLLDRDSNNIWVLVSGIGGTENALRTIVDKISIGGITEKFIPTHIVANMSDAYEGLIGMDILSNYTLTIDSSNNRLIANLVPEAKDLPGGRNRSWWGSTFREFTLYRDFLDTHAELATNNKPPYSKLADGRRAEYKMFLLDARDDARALFQKLQNYARWNKVPTHWRK